MERTERDENTGAEGETTSANQRDDEEEEKEQQDAVSNNVDDQENELDGCEELTVSFLPLGNANDGDVGGAGLVRVREGEKGEEEERTSGMIQAQSSLVSSLYVVGVSRGTKR